MLNRFAIAIQHSNKNINSPKKYIKHEDMVFLDMLTIPASHNECTVPFILNTLYQHPLAEKKLSHRLKIKT